jgi:hypothetical protein
LRRKGIGPFVPFLQFCNSILQSLRPRRTTPAAYGARPASTYPIRSAMASPSMRGTSRVRKMGSPDLVMHAPPLGTEPHVLDVADDLDFIHAGQAPAARTTFSSIATLPMSLAPWRGSAGRPCRPASPTTPAGYRSCRARCAR